MYLIKSKKSKKNKTLQKLIARYLLKQKRFYNRERFAGQNYEMQQMSFIPSSLSIQLK